MKFREKFFRREKSYSGRSINFVVDRITLPNGKKGIREYVRHPGAVTALPFLDSKRIVLVRQYRYPVRKMTYELPAGKLEKGENPLACVRRELIEETGFKASNVEKLISYWPTPAFSTEVIHIYVATRLSPVKGTPDEDEFLSKVVISFEDALKYIHEGKILDSKSIIALLLYEKNRKIRPR